MKFLLLQRQKRVIDLTPRNMQIVMVLSIFASELVVMLLLSEMPQLNRWVESLLDASILLLLLSPFYFLVYRPFWSERQRHERQISYLSGQLLTAAEEERRRVTHELHDQCGQTLTALQFGIQTVKRKLPEEAEECRSQVDRLIEVAAQLADELRRVTTQLRPSALDEFGLHLALRSLVKEYSESYPEIALEVRLFRETDLQERLAPAVEDALYRVCQEALTNIARYAAADQVTLRLSLHGRQIALLIEDNGRGFDLEEFWQKRSGFQGIGLLGMRERIRSLGGKFEVRSSPGQGTRIEALLPLLG